MFQKILTLLIGSTLLLFISLNKAYSAVVGPDNYGYVAIDSNEPNGPTFDWIDITQTGNFWPHLDDDYIQVPIGFTFNFYGVDYNTVYINSNGTLSFGSGYTNWVNFDFPENNNIPMIAPFFDDLIRRSADAGVYYQTLGTAPNRMFVVTWYIEDHYYSTPSEVTFQVILYEGSNYIKFQYQDVVFDNTSYDYGASATVGLNKGDGTTALQYSYNQPVLENNMAIIIKNIIVSKTNVNFNYVKIGKTKLEKILIKNPENFSININLTLTGDDVFDLHTDIGDDPCGGTSFMLPAGQSCEIYVSFSPDDERIFNANLDVNSPTLGFNFDVPITGIGEYPVVQILGLDDTNYKVIVRGQTNIIEIRNPGNVPLEIISLIINNLRYFEIDLYAGANPCGNIFGSVILPLDFSVDDINNDADFGIQPGTSCTIGIKSRGTDERKTANLEIHTDDPNNGIIRILLQISGFINGPIDSSLEGGNSSSVINLSGGGGNCSFAPLSSGIPIYLLIPLIIAIRRFIRK